LGGIENVQHVVGTTLAPALKAAGFRRVGSSFVRRIPESPLSQVVHVEPSRARAGDFVLTVAIASAPIAFWWTGKKDRSPTANWLETWRAEELTGDTRHRTFHAEDPSSAIDLSRAVEKIAATLRREPYRSVTAILKRTKAPAKQAAILHALGRTGEALAILDREIAKAADESNRDALTAEKQRLSEPPPSA
jgi:hypothetical protein